MKHSRIIFTVMLVVILVSALDSVQAAEVLPETGTISYTDYSGYIEFTDINAGANGQIFITEKYFGSAVVVNPLGNGYELYSLAFSGDKGDVQPAPDGRIWYTDNKAQLGVFDPADCPDIGDNCPETIWEFPYLGEYEDQINIGPFTFDDQGHVWVGDFAGTIPMLYQVSQINATQLEYCPFDIGGYHTHDLKFHDGAVWFGDYVNQRILRFEPTSETTGNLSFWQLPEEADPDGMVFDASGGLWWGEITRGYIGHLTFGETDTLTYYAIPVAAQPVGISIQSGKIWYSDKNGKVGQLDPDLAAPYSSSSSTEVSLGEKSTICANLDPYLETNTYFMERKPLPFSPFDPLLDPETSTPGWTIYTLPAGSIPAGMAAVHGAIYVADSNTSVVNAGKLVRFSLPQDQYNVFLPLILR